MPSIDAVSTTATSDSSAPVSPSRKRRMFLDGLGESRWSLGLRMWKALDARRESFGYA